MPLFESRSGSSELGAPPPQLSHGISVTVLIPCRERLGAQSPFIPHALSYVGLSGQRLLKEFFYPEH
jgi:hypothetical protein